MNRIQRVQLGGGAKFLKGLGELAAAQEIPGALHAMFGVLPKLAIHLEPFACGWPFDKNVPITCVFDHGAPIAALCWLGPSWSDSCPPSRLPVRIPTLGAAPLPRTGS